MAGLDDGELVTTPGALDDLVGHLRRSGRFAFDTEFVSEETFEPILGLIQVATADRISAIDPIGLDDLSAFWDLILDPSIEVVTHAAGEDLRIVRFQAGRLPERVVDVQVAAGLLGFPYPASLGNLVSQVAGVGLAGGETRTDWRRRPLTPAQIRYALDDVRHLLRVADRLGERIDALGRRDWAEEEYRALIRRVEARDDEDRWRRLPGLHHLSRRGLQVARGLSEWRRDEARRVDRPLRQVMRDDLLVAIAKRQPANRRDLEALRDFNRPHLLSQSGAILDAVSRARDVPDGLLPDHAERHDEGPGLSMVVNLLAATLARCCARSHVSASLVGSNSDLKDLVHWHSLGEPADRLPDLARGWRGEVCGAALLDVLTGRTALRIVDPGSDVPVAFVDPSGPGSTRHDSA